MSQYVQHISGQGEKWELDIRQCFDNWWKIHSASGISIIFPKSEYRLCDPPERWVDITAECEMTKENWPNSFGEGPALIDMTNSSDRHNCILIPSQWTKRYRLRKVQLYEWTYLHNGTYKSGETTWAFKVEKKEIGS